MTRAREGRQRRLGCAAGDVVPFELSVETIESLRSVWYGQYAIDCEPLRHDRCSV